MKVSINQFTGIDKIDFPKIVKKLASTTFAQNRPTSLSWWRVYEAGVQEMPFEVQLLASYCVVPNGTREGREPKIPKLKSTLPP